MFSHIGKTYTEELISLLRLDSASQSTIYSGFIISPFFVLLLTSFVSVPIMIYRYRKLSITLIQIFFFFFGFFGIFSSYHTEYLLWYSLPVSIMIIGTVVWSIINRTYVIHASQEIVKYIFQTLYFQLFVSLLFQIIIIFFQMIKSSELGLFIEQYITIFGDNKDTLNLLYKFRPFGISPHPNLMAYQFLDMFGCFVLLHVMYMKKNSENKYLFILLCLTFISILFSQSRAAYLASLCIYIPLIWYYRKKLKQWIAYGFSKVFIHTLVLAKYIFSIVCVVIFMFIVFPRVQDITSIGASAGWNFRKEFNKEAFELIVQHPLLGVGPGMFVAGNLQTHPFGINYSFPYEVHNNFLLLMAEFGMVAFLCYLLGIMSLLRAMAPFKKIAFFVWCVILSLIIVGFFHALERTLPLTILILMIIPFYGNNVKKNT